MIYEEWGSFRAERGCVDKVCVLRQVENACERAKGVYGRSWDLKKVYGCVDKILWQMLQIYGVICWMVLECIVILVWG